MRDVYEFLSGVRDTPLSNVKHIRVGKYSSVTYEKKINSILFYYDPY